MKKNILSNLSKIPPCPFKIFEKSFKLLILLIYEKKISPKNNDIDNKIEMNNGYSNKYNKVAVNRKDNIVPDQVFFGLIEGIINGPFIIFPNKYAKVSLKNETNIIKNNKSLSL